MRVGEKAVQRRVALALAHLCSPDDQRTIFIDNNGMSHSVFSPSVNSSFWEHNLTHLYIDDILYYHVGLELLLVLLGSASLKQQLDGAVALFKLANKATSLSPVDAAPPSPTPQVTGL